MSCGVVRFSLETEIRFLASNIIWAAEILNRRRAGGLTGSFYGDHCDETADYSSRSGVCGQVGPCAQPYRASKEQRSEQEANPVAFWRLCAVAARVQTGSGGQWAQGKHG